VSGSNTDEGSEIRILPNATASLRWRFVCHFRRPPSAYLNRGRALPCSPCPEWFPSGPLRPSRPATMVPTGPTEGKLKNGPLPCAGTPGSATIQKAVLDKYFDNAATTPLDPRVWGLCFRSFRSSRERSFDSRLWHPGRAAVEDARSRVAALIGAEDPSQIVFTSGATEANNWLLSSFCERLGQPIRTQQRPRAGRSARISRSPKRRLRP